MNSTSRPSTPSATNPASAEPGAASTGALHDWFVVSAPGLEAVVESEVRELTGASDVRAVPGGVEMKGSFEVGLRANVFLRTATRVVLRLGEERARDFAPLRRSLARLPWESYLPAGRPVRIDASASRCRLYHTGGLAEAVAHAIGDRTGHAPTLAPKLPPGSAQHDDRDDDQPDQNGDHAGDHADRDPPGPAAEPVRVLVRGELDRFTVSIDASGALLHRRGWRLEAGPAPMRETLASGLLALAGWQPTVEPLVDPLCGSGTIVIEAASRALGRAAGLGRTFACESWPCADAALVARVRQEAAGLVRNAPGNLPWLAGFDRDATVLDRARRNADRAGLTDVVQWEASALGDQNPRAASGLLITNPPYGRRLSSGSPGQLGAQIGRALRGPFRGWRAAVLVPAASNAPHPTARAVGLPLLASHALRNGGLRVQLLLFAPAG